MRRVALLDGFSGSWAGSNGFRLMPTDDLADLPAELTVSRGAGGHLTSVSYTWRHPSDGPQEGLLVFGAADDGTLTALWGDSWHQQPAPMTLSGRDAIVEADYGGGWKWRIGFDTADPSALRMRMDNVIPDSHAGPDKPAGPYPVMLMTLRRA